MKTKARIGWLIPTNNPRALFNYFLKNIDIIACDEFKLLIIFQPPWDMDKIHKFISHCKMEVNYHFLTPRKPISMIDLRNKCAMLDRSVDYYVIADDNFLFTKGTTQYPLDSFTRYQQVIEYMDTFDNCGYVMCEGSLGGSIQKLTIKPTLSGLVSTQRGIFFRNLKEKSVYPVDSLHLAGGCEETIICYDLISKGYFPAKQFNNPTQHKDKKKVQQDANKGTVHCYDTLMNNVIKYVREKYRTNTWTNDTRFFPKELIRQYLKSGGDQEWLNKDSNEYVLDFPNKLISLF